MNFGHHRLHVGGISISAYTALTAADQETTDFMSVVLSISTYTALTAVDADTTDFMSVVSQFQPKQFSALKPRKLVVG